MIEVRARYTARQFAELVARESDEVEVKTGAGRRPMQECLVAMTNTSGGVVLIGVRDDRTVVGRSRDQGLDDDIHGAAGDAHDIGRYEIRQVDVAGMPVVAVVVRPRADAVAQTSDGRVLVRRGGHNRPVFARDLQRLIASRSLVRFEEEDSGVHLSRADLDALTALCRASGWDPGDPNLPERLRELGLLVGDGDSLTMAGALVLTDPAATLRTRKFHVDVRGYESISGVDYVRRTQITGPLPLQVAAAVDLVMHDLGSDQVVTGARRQDIDRLPRLAVREVIANAIAHRAYDRDQTPVVVEVRPDRLVVTSPGQLPPPVTIETIRAAQSPRNHAVLAVLRRLGLAEDSGLGVDRVQDSMRDEFLDPPVFAEAGDAVEVVLPLRATLDITERAWLRAYEQDGTIDHDDRLLLITVRREGRVTNATARAATGLDSTEVRRRLARLAGSGILDRDGQRGGASYSLARIGPAPGAQELVLRAAAEGPVTNAAVRELTGLDRAAVLALLQRLVHEGSLVQEGSRRGTRYRLPPRRRRD